MATDISKVPEELLSVPSTESLSTSLVDLSLDGEIKPSDPPETPIDRAKASDSHSKSSSPRLQSSASPIPKRRLLNIGIVPVSSPNPDSSTPSRSNHPTIGRYSPVLSPPKERTASGGSGDSATNESAVGPAPSAAGSAIAAAREQDSMLSKYLSELASKESRVSGLKQHLAELRAALQEAEREVRAAETDLKRFKASGNSLVEHLSTSSPSLRQQSIAELSDAALARKLSRSPSPQRRGPPVPKRENEMLVMGKRVVDEINQQFWSFVEDVKTATIGPEDFYEEEQSTRPSQDRGRQQQAPRLKPKQSFSNMVESIRKLSPERRPQRSDSDATRRSRAQSNRP